MKVLVVDDELYICELLYEFLSMHGHRVTVAVDGLEALLKYEKDRPDVVILDIAMPDMNGIEVLRQIKEKEIDTKTEIIILSAYGDSMTVQGALKMGASYFLEKPVEIERLLNILYVSQRQG